MDKPSMPWSLIGISDEARKIVRVRAAENDQTMGQWLNDQILRNAATGSTDPADQTPNPPVSPSMTQDILARIEEILDSAEQLSTAEIESYQIALNELTRRLNAMETTENN
jgi:hypothetical protein